jgi:hypothetical protein
MLHGKKPLRERWVLRSSHHKGERSMKIPDEKDVFVSEFVSNSVFQEWLYVFTIQLGIRASPAVTHYTSWTSSAMDET